MSGIILLMNLQFSWRISYNFPTLHKNTIQTKPRRITIHSIIITTLRQVNNRGWSESVLELLKTLLTSLRPFKHGLLLSKSCQWVSNERKTLQESVIITSQSQEAMNIRGSNKFWPFFNNLSLPGSTSATLSNTTWTSKVTDLSKIHTCWIWHTTNVV